MKNSDNEINVLDELNKGVSMGMDAIHYVLDKAEDKNLKKELEHQYKEYESISNKTCKLYSKFSEKDPHETSVLNKVLTWYGVEMKTLVENSASKIAEMMLQGTNMGIIEGRKLLNHKDIDDKVHSLVEEFVDMQESAVENLKQFL